MEDTVVSSEELSGITETNPTRPEIYQNICCLAETDDWDWVTCLVALDVSFLGPHLLLGSCTSASVGSKEQFLFEGIFWGKGHSRVCFIYVLLTEVSHSLPAGIPGMCRWDHLYLLWNLQLCLTCRAVPVSLESVSHCFVNCPCTSCVYVKEDGPVLVWQCWQAEQLSQLGEST